MQTKNIKATPEQDHATHTALQKQSFKVLAFAGSGKTTTLKLIGDALAPKRGLYLAFNKAIANHAQSQFGGHIQCRTFHSLAYRNVPAWLTNKLKFPRLSPSLLAKEHNLEAQLIQKLVDGQYQKAILTPNRMASIVSNALTYFCSTNAQQPAPRHITFPDGLHPLEEEKIRQYLYPALLKRWQDAIDPTHQAGISHDIYLKYWALCQPQLPFDFILFDEAQDADPLMLGILLKQNTQVIYVGDPYQQIYQWRGAVNAMQQLPLTETRLTQSFRFGDKIAECANVVLQSLGEKTPLQANPNVQSYTDLSPFAQNTNAILCRTNGKAMTLLMQGLIQNHKVALQADQSRLLNFVTAAEKLKNNVPSNDVPELAWFSRWKDVQEYSETNDGSDLKPLIKLVDEHGTQALKIALQKICAIDQADYVISTAHKAKGLEWNKIHIEDDFNFKVGKNGVNVQDDELRLLYVAITRAKLGLNIHHILPLIGALKKQNTELAAPKTAAT